MHLARRVIQVIIAAYDVSDAHIAIVNDNAKMECGRTVRAYENQIIQFRVLELDAATHQILDYRHACIRRPKPEDRRYAGRRSSASPAASIVPRIFASRYLVSTPGLQFLAGTVTVVGLAGAQKLVGNLSVSGKPLALVKRSFVVFQSYPVQTLEDDIYCLLGRPLPVRILDTENELAAVMPGIEP